jgi:hypothetical protein
MHLPRQLHLMVVHELVIHLPHGGGRRLMPAKAIATATAAALLVRMRPQTGPAATLRCTANRKPALTATTSGFFRASDSRMEPAPACEITRLAAAMSACSVCESVKR